jgi:hypothetical protein
MMGSEKPAWRKTEGPSPSQQQIRLSPRSDEAHTTRLRPLPNHIHQASVALPGQAYALARFLDCVCLLTKCRRVLDGAPHAEIGSEPDQVRPKPRVRSRPPRSVGRAVVLESGSDTWRVKDDGGRPGGVIRPCRVPERARGHVSQAGPHHWGARTLGKGTFSVSAT